MPRTVFLAGGSGFIGAEFCRASVAAGDTVLALCRSQESAGKAEALGAIPVHGDLLEAGDWQKQARNAEYVVHLAQPEVVGGRVTIKRAKLYRHRRLLMDANLLGTLDPQRVKRVVYVSGTSYYGNLGAELHDETATPRPHGIGRFIVDVVERLGAYLEGRVPIVTAFPGYVYGPGSWFREYLFTPLVRGRRLVACGGRSPFGSPIHVEDCGRAIVHLLDHGNVGGRFFLVDDKPVQWSTLQKLTAAALGLTPRFLTVPRWLVPIVMGRIMAESLVETNSVLSNSRLKALGFAFRYATVDTGIPAVVAQLQAEAAQR
jgi:nucleoside-diphosphate-sugar epimerase